MNLSCRLNLNGSISSCQKVEEGDHFNVDLVIICYALCFVLCFELCVACRYVGHVKERSLKDQMAKDPTEVIRKAVLRMLPRNKLRDVSS